MKKKINIDTWPRRAQYELFKTMDYPHFNICANVDITNFYAYIKSNDLSFYTTMIYVAAKVANEITEFKYRISGEEVIEYDIIHPSFTIMSQPEVFNFCSVPYIGELSTFTQLVNDKVQKRQGTIDLDSDQNKEDQLYITSIPWVSFTSMSHPINMKSVDSIPRIAFGRYFNENTQIKMPLSVQVNHILMDGVHVGKYFERIQEILDKPDHHL